MDDVFLCHECGKVFYKLSTLESHAKWKHNDKTVEYMCDQCGRTFQKKYNLQKHIEVGVHYVAETVRCAAEECNFRAPNRKGMCSHYENYHGICLSETTVYFSSTGEFYDWKSAYESRTRARFVKMSSSRKRKNGIIKCTYLCHRDGNFIPKGKNMRHMKGKGSNKINAHCPAKMEVDISEKLVTVSYIDTHVGHDLDIFRLSLNPTDKASIAKLLAMQVPFEEILNEINALSKSVSDSDGIKRLNLLTRKDLWNIVETFKIDPKTVVYSKSRSKRKSEMEQFKSDETQTNFHTVEGDEVAGEDEKLLVYPVIVKEGNNEYFEEYTVVSDDNAIDDERNCIIINSQGELEYISGDHIIYTEDDGIQICESDRDAIYVAGEEEVNDCEITGTGEIIFIDDETYKIEKSPGCEEEVVEIIEEEMVLEDANFDPLIKQEVYDTENGEENEAVQSVLVETLPKSENLEFEVTEQGLNDDEVNEYVIISTEEDDCNVISKDCIDIKKNTSLIMPANTTVISSLDNVLDIFRVEKAKKTEPQWDEKRKEVLSKLLNVHSMVNNEKQLTVLSNNISSLENVIKSLSENHEQVPHSTVGSES